MLAAFMNGPLDGIEREIEIPFAIIEVFWIEGMDPATVPFFQTAIGTQEIWQYSLQESDYETYATYLGELVGDADEIQAEYGVWTAAGRHFDVLNEDDFGSVTVQIGGDAIYFPELEITVRLAQRQGE